MRNPKDTTVPADSAWVWVNDQRQYAGEEGRMCLELQAGEYEVSALWILHEYEGDVVDIDYWNQAEHVFVSVGDSTLYDLYLLAGKDMSE